MGGMDLLFLMPIVGEAEIGEGGAVPRLSGR